MTTDRLVADGGPPPGVTAPVRRPVVAIDQTAARAAFRAALDQVTALIQTIPDPRAPVPGLTWNVGETGAHLVSGLRIYTDCARGGVSPVTDFADLAAVNARGLAQFPERDPVVVAEQLVAAGHDFLDATEGRSGGELMVWHEGQPQKVSTVTTIALGELLIHGLDIARALGQRWSIAPQAARLVIAGMTRLLPRFPSERTVRGAAASYEIRVRGGARLVCRFANGGLAVEPPGGRIDCVISADPVAFLLVGYGRIGQWGPIARGQLLAWGRRPWRSLQFTGLLRSP